LPLFFFPPIGAQQLVFSLLFPMSVSALMLYFSPTANSPPIPSQQLKIPDANR